MNARIGSLCSGYEGLSMAVRAVLGGELAFVADNDPGASAILAHRFPSVRNLGDITATDWDAVEPVDIVTAGFPCFAEGTRILTETGWRPIENVEVGDFVLTHAGRWMPVTATMSRVADHRVTLHGHGLPRIITTEEHPFYARAAHQEWVGHKRGSPRRRTFSGPQWVEASKMAGQFAGQVLPPVEDSKYDTDFWWVVGRYLADGWTTSGGGRKHNRVAICCAHDEADELEARLRPVIHATRSEDVTSTKFYITRAWFVDFLSFLGRGAAGKTLTRRELALPSKKARALLDGWLSGDGCRMKQGTETGWQATTVSRSLALSMALLTQRAYGVVARVYETTVPPQTTIAGREVGQRTQYKVSIPDRNRSAVIDGDYGWKLVRKAVRTDGPILVYNLSIARDESYVADGAIVHNCQDVSCAGLRRGLRAGTRTGVWLHVARAIDALRPSLVLLENVGGLLSEAADSHMERCPWCLGDTGHERAVRALGAVLGDLAEIGFDAEWRCVRASDAGAPHRRERVFILAWPAADATDGGQHELHDGSEPRAHDPQSVNRPAGVAGDDRGSRFAAADACGPGLEIGAVEHHGPERQAAQRSHRNGTAEDPDRSTGSERRFPAPGQETGRGTRADTGGPGGAPTAADADSGGWSQRRQGGSEARGSTEADGCAAADATGDGRHQGRPEPAGLIGGPDAAERGSATPADADSTPGGRHEPRSGPGTLQGASVAEWPQEQPGRLHSGSGDTSPVASADTQGERRAGGQQSQQDVERDRPEPAHTGPHRGTWGPYEPAIRRWEAVIGRPAPSPTEPGRTGQRLSPRFVEFLMGLPEGWVTDVPGLSRNAQLKALGNGVVPAQAELALRLLLGAITTEEAA